MKTKEEYLGVGSKDKYVKVWSLRVFSMSNDLVKCLFGALISKSEERVGFCHFLTPNILRNLF